MLLKYIVIICKNLNKDFLIYTMGVIMNEDNFNPAEFYDSYPLKIILRPGYPTRSSYKSTIMWKIFGTCPESCKKNKFIR